MNITPGLIVMIAVFAAGIVITTQTKEFLHFILACVLAFVLLVIVDWFWARVRGY